MEAFPERPDSRLQDFLVSAYLKSKRNDEALQLTWIQFEERPSLDCYKKLHDVASALSRWPEQRNRALERIAEVIAHKESAAMHWKPKIHDYSLRLEIALWENDLDAAWSAAHDGVCDLGLLITLAEALESTRPENAISLYHGVVPSLVAQTSNSAYEKAVKLVRKIRKLMTAANQLRRFDIYLSELHVTFKPKRNFIKLLNAVPRATAGMKLTK